MGGDFLKGLVLQNAISSKGKVIDEDQLKLGPQKNFEDLARPEVYVSEHEKAKAGLENANIQAGWTAYSGLGWIQEQETALTIATDGLKEASVNLNTSADKIATQVELLTEEISNLRKAIS